MTDIKTSMRRYAESGSASRKVVVKYSRPNPWLDCQREQRFLYIHIPRTAGGSLVKALPPRREVGHIPAYVYHDWEPDTFASCYKAAFVRNPWDRLVSAFFRVRDGAKNPLTASWGKRNLAGFNCFESFLTALEGQRAFREVVLSYPHFRPQGEFVSIGGQVAVDFVGRFENLHADFRKLAATLRLGEVELTHEHKSKRLAYEEYYCDRTINIAARLYEVDIRTFGYSF